MGFLDLFKSKKEKEEISYLKNKIVEFEEKYLTEMVEQLNEMTKVDFVALPSLLGGRTFGVWKKRTSTTLCC